MSEALQQRVTHHAQALGYSRLWSTFSGYYERFGWQTQGEALEYPDKRVKLYYRDL